MTEDKVAVMRPKNARIFRKTISPAILLLLGGPAGGRGRFSREEVLLYCVSKAAAVRWLLPCGFVIVFFIYKRICIGVKGESIRQIELSTYVAHQFRPFFLRGFCYTACSK